MTRSAHRWTSLAFAAALTAVAALGCDRTNSTNATVPNSGTGMTGAFSGKQVTGPTAYQVGPDSHDGAGGAPTFGEATGTGFHTGDAAHSSGTGSGLMGFHGTGAEGTINAISDMHPAGDPPKDAPVPILPEE